ncbi:MAG: hypothetical protein AAGJ87_02025, partial [Pseudomonadota bacterium]
VTPGVALERDARGHQMVFTRAALDILLDLYRNDLFRSCNLGTCFDHGAPFAASLAGDLYFSRDALVKFRRHEGATSDAGQGDVSGVGRDLADRLAARARVMSWRADMIEKTLAILDAHAVDAARDLKASRAAYAAYGALAKKRMALAADANMISRATALPVIASAALRDGADAKDIAADFLTALRGAPMTKH